MYNLSKYAIFWNEEHEVLSVLTINKEVQLQEESDYDCAVRIAKKDIPSGVKFKIIDVSDLPDDRTFRMAWTSDFTEYDGVGGRE